MELSFMSSVDLASLQRLQMYLHAVYYEFNATLEPSSYHVVPPAVLDDSIWEDLSSTTCSLRLIDRMLKEDQ